MTISRRLDALEAKPTAHLATDRPVPANVIEFATGPAFLGLRLYPRQATLVKLLCLALELLTPYDLEVIVGWAAGFTAIDHIDGRRWSGISGIVPDVLERAEHCRRAGRWTWSEIVLVMGRRSSKSLISSIVLTWQVWRFLQLGDPQQHFGLPKAKQIILLVYGASKETARRDLFADLVERFRDSPCFAPYLHKITATSISLYTPAQLARGDNAVGRPGLIKISAQATRSNTARGPAVFSLCIDEAAHLDGAGSTNTTQELLDAARPALAQFDLEATTILPSSPWAMTGAFYDSFVRACAIDPVTGRSLRPTRVAIQLPSWALYLDYEQAYRMQMWPAGPTFERIDHPILSFNDALRSQEEDNPEQFNVEIRSQFTSGVGRYFSEATIAKLFAEWSNSSPAPNAAVYGRDYVIHCDPSTSGANFGLSVAHLEYDEHGNAHVIFDHLHAFRPEEFSDHRVDYQVVLEYLLDLIDEYRPTALRFDNHNVAFFLDRLAPELRRRGLPTTVAKVTTTRAEKFERFEHFKTLINQGFVHAPPHPLAIQEARFIQADGYRIAHAMSGPCVTDDLIDAMTWDVRHLVGRNAFVPSQLRDVHPGGQRTVFPPNPYAEQFSSLGRNARRDPSRYNPAAQARGHRDRR